MTRREMDMMAAWSVDRLGRSLQHLIAFLGELYSIQQPQSSPRGDRSETGGNPAVPGGRYDELPSLAVPLRAIALAYSYVAFTHVDPIRRDIYFQRLAAA